MRNLEAGDDKVRRGIIKDRKKLRAKVDDENLFSSSSDDEDIIK